MIELLNVTKIYNRGRHNEFSAVRGITLELIAGECVIIKGPSGSGKSSLLSLIGCMHRPTSGRIRLHGAEAARVVGSANPAEPVEVTSLPERYLTEIRRQLFGFIFQQFNLVRGITALENVMLPAYPLGVPRSVIRKNALELFDSLGIAHRATARIEHLSGGEQQRVAIARALITRPTALIADEPTAHLDSNLSREFLAIVEKLKLAGTTLIIASHDPLVYDSPLADKVVEVRDGLLLSPGSSR